MIIIIWPYLGLANGKPEKRARQEIKRAPQTKRHTINVDISQAVPCFGSDMCVCMCVFFSFFRVYSLCSVVIIIIVVAVLRIVYRHRQHFSVTLLPVFFTSLALAFVHISELNAKIAWHAQYRKKNTSHILTSLS